MAEVERMIHAVKENSVIYGRVQVGDKLVAVDDEDVRTMTAVKVSKLISRKSANPSRKLTILRTTTIDWRGRAALSSSSETMERS